jgi:endonuclease-8
VSDDEALAAVRAIRPLMRRSATGRGYEDSFWVYRRAGRPCKRCNTLVQSGGIGDDNRTAYWCPTCQT